MSIAVLTQVYDEVRRLAVAGSVVAAGDFRLKKLIAPLEQAGTKAPIFAKVGQAVKGLVESNEKTSAEALLELSTLVNAILYTQGETGRAGKLETIETIDLGEQKSQASAKVLKPLLEALSTTGSGRHEIIKDSHERGAFRDLRMVKPALQGLDDPYSEIGDYIADNVLPMYGKAILPDLRAKFDPKGKAGGAPRRLKLMHRLDPEGTREIVKNVLEGGAKELKVVAIECLGDSPEDLSYLLEQAKAKAKDVRQAALIALAKSTAPEAVAVLQKGLTSADIDLAVNAVRTNRDPKIMAFVISELDGQMEALLKTKEKDKKVVGKQVERMRSLMHCLQGRHDTQGLGEAPNDSVEHSSGSEAFLLRMFEQRDKIAAIKGEPSGQDLLILLTDLMAYGTKKLQNALIAVHATLPDYQLSDAFAAARQARTAAEVYDMFSPYLLAKVDEKKKKTDPNLAKRTAIEEGISENMRYRYWGYRGGYSEEKLKDLDPRWLDAAVTLKNLGLVQVLARSEHAAANDFLEQAFQENLKKAKDFYDAGHVLETMVHIQHPKAAASVIAVLKKLGKGKNMWGAYWIGRLIPDLPKTALPELEELLPTLDEKVIDHLMDYVMALKSK